MKELKSCSPVNALKSWVKISHTLKFSVVKSAAFNIPTNKIVMRGSKKAFVNFDRSILKASIIIIDGPTFSVLRRTLIMFKQCLETMKLISNWKVKTESEWVW